MRVWAGASPSSPLSSLIHHAAPPRGATHGNLSGAGTRTDGWVGDPTNTLQLLTLNLEKSRNNVAKINQRSIAGKRYDRHPT